MTRQVSDAERRARLARRHHLAPGHEAPDVETAADSLVALHATDPATIFQSARARAPHTTVADLEQALHDERTLVRHMAMRRTLWVFPRARLADAQAAASNRVAEAQRRRLVKDVEEAGLHADGGAWLQTAGDATVAALAGGRELTSTELRGEVEELDGWLVYSPHKSYGGRMAVAGRVLTVLSAQGRIVRATNNGRWSVARPRWTATEAWLGEPIARRGAAEGTAAMVTAWLRAFGPGTERDIKWWLGSTLALVRAALQEIGAVAVTLEDGSQAYLLADDLEAEPPLDEPWAALLPPLDPTTMGWQERAFYLGPYRDQLFDTAGNAGPTAWWDGRIVGGWRQDDAGAVELQLLEDPGAAARRALTAEAAALTEWFAGARVMPRFPSPLSRRLAG